MIKRFKTKINDDAKRLDEVTSCISLCDIEAQHKEISSPTPPGEYLTIKQAGKYLHVNRTTIWRYSKQGLLKPRRIGCHVLFARADIDNYLMREEGHGEH